MQNRRKPAATADIFSQKCESQATQGKSRDRHIDGLLCLVIQPIEDFLWIDEEMLILRPRGNHCVNAIEFSR